MNDQEAQQHAQEVTDAPVIDAPMTQQAQAATNDAEREAALHATAPVTDALPGVSYQSTIKLANDDAFRGLVQAQSPNGKSLLVSVSSSGQTGWRVGSNRWVLVENVLTLTDADPVEVTKRSARSSKRSKSNTQNESTNDDNGSTIAKDTQMTDQTQTLEATTSPNRTAKNAEKLMGSKPAGDAAPKQSKKQKDAAAVKKAVAGKAASKKSATPKAAKTPKGPREFTAAGHAALPNVLRSDFTADRINWNTDKWANPHKLTFPKPASAVYYVAGGQAWGFVEQPDATNEKFWRFHFIEKGEAWEMNRALGYDSVEAADAAAKAKAEALGTIKKHTAKF